MERIGKQQNHTMGRMDGNRNTSGTFLYKDVKEKGNARKEGQGEVRTKENKEQRNCPSPPSPLLRRERTMRMEFIRKILAWIPVKEHSNP